MAELCTKRGKSWWFVYICKPVLQHFHTCLLEGMKTGLSAGVGKALERFMYCFGLGEELSKAASSIRNEIIT